MIISASYKTDIPAFYGEWFMNRLQAGHCKMVNPYGRQVYTASLAKTDVDGFVFWTRNAGPFLPRLSKVRELGYPFLFQYTLTGYPRVLEPAVVAVASSVEHIRRLSGVFGPRVAVWRYDPVVFTSLTPPDFHRRNFATLARLLAGVVDEVVISFAQIYRKTRRNLDIAARSAGFDWYDPPDEVKWALAVDFQAIASSYGMQLSTCSQSRYCVPGAVPARCIDANRLSDVAGYRIATRQQGNRPDCLCDQSRDIGDYDTCIQGCAYCYAVGARIVAQERYRRHNPHGEFLFSDSGQHKGLPSS